MDFEFPDNLRVVLTSMVDEARGSYSGDYPIDPREREEAGNVQKALQQLGYEVSLSDAAAVWESYSLHLQAGWLAGAENIVSAGECLRYHCEEIADS